MKSQNENENEAAMTRHGCPDMIFRGPALLSGPRDDKAVEDGNVPVSSAGAGACGALGLELLLALALGGIVRRYGRAESKASTGKLTS